jgi:hypothetical protein
MRAEIIQYRNRLRAGQPRSRYLIPDNGKRFFFSPLCAGWLWGPLNRLFSGYQGSPPGEKGGESGMGLELMTCLHLVLRLRLLDLYLLHCPIHLHSTSQPLYVPQKSSQYPWDRRLSEPQSSSGWYGELKIVFPFRTWNLSCPTSRYTDVATTSLTYMWCGS